MEDVGIGIVAFLVLFPLLVALVQLLVRSDTVRTYLTVVSALVIACGSVFCAAEFGGEGTTLLSLDSRTSSVVDYVAVGIDVVLCAYIVYRGISCRKWLAVLLAVVQLCLLVYVDFGVMDEVEVANALYIDDLSIVMALIIGVIGSAICVYALGYMRDHEARAHASDRRPVFFSLMFAFLGAMFAIVFTNELTWMLCAWEVTTVCSFALIGYTRTDEAIDNSFLQIVLNLLGGIAFSGALVWIGTVMGVNELDQFLSLGSSLMEAGYTVLVYVPVLLLCFAGFVKAAQMPFQNWLLGAMVAPTPTSALLHSSTMVKAGVFLLIKLSPLLGFNLPGYTVMLVGGVTFLFAALAAISQSNAKRVLAYSTISNLGLITACAGVGTDGAVWAAIFLVIFHAAAKSLLFCCVGTAEHHIGSRDIESMDGLFERMPRLSRLMALGILAMFIAPFGMLVSKWAALEAFATSENIVLMLLLAFGSAATFMFWAKWLGKIVAASNGKAEDVEQGVSGAEWASLGLMAVVAVGCCIGFPLISSMLVVPYLETVFGDVSATISQGDLWIMAVIACLLAVIMLGFSGTTKKKVVPVYLAGGSVDSQARTFRGSLGQEIPATQRNWYMEDVFGEKKMKLVGCVVSIALIVCSFSWCVQEVADNQDVVGYSIDARASYAGSSWEEDSDADFSMYLYYYLYNVESFEEYPEEYEEYYGFTSMEDLMEDVYDQLYGSDDDSYFGDDDDDTSSEDDDAQSSSDGEGGE